RTNQESSASALGRRRPPDRRRSSRHSGRTGSEAAQEERTPPTSRTINTRAVMPDRRRAGNVKCPERELGRSIQYRLTHQAEATTSRTSTPSSVTSSLAAAAIALTRSPAARAFSSESKMTIERPFVSPPPVIHVQ